MVSRPVPLLTGAPSCTLLSSWRFVGQSPLPFPAAFSQELPSAGLGPWTVLTVQLVLPSIFPAMYPGEYVPPGVQLHSSRVVAFAQAGDPQVVVTFCTQGLASVWH